MIKRIKGSLFAKVFILTVAVLLCVSFLVYGVLAWYMPQTYSNNLNAALDEQTSDFIYELEHIRMQDSGGLLISFFKTRQLAWWSFILLMVFWWKHRLTKIALTMGSPGRLLAEHLMKVRRLYPTAITSHLQMIITNIF